MPELTGGLIAEGYCPRCSRGKDKPVKTDTSIHGSCLVCGFQKFPSKYRHSRVRGQ